MPAREGHVKTGAGFIDPRSAQHKISPRGVGPSGCFLGRVILCKDGFVMIHIMLNHVCTHDGVMFMPAASRHISIMYSKGTQSLSK